MPLTPLSGPTPRAANEQLIAAGPRLAPTNTPSATVTANTGFYLQWDRPITRWVVQNLLGAGNLYVDLETTEVPDAVGDADFVVGPGESFSLPVNITKMAILNSVEIIWSGSGKNVYISGFAGE